MFPGACRTGRGAGVLESGVGGGFSAGYAHTRLTRERHTFELCRSTPYVDFFVDKLLLMYFPYDLHQKSSGCSAIRTVYKMRVNGLFVFSLGALAIRRLDGRFGGVRCHAGG